MRISDLLRKAAELIDQSEAGGQPEQPEPGDLAPVTPDNTDNTDTATMIGPLQQKHEMLKKVSDIANDTEKFDDPMSDDGSCEQAPDELDVLKQIAGIGENNGQVDTAVKAAHFISDDHESD